VGLRVGGLTGCVGEERYALPVDFICEKEELTFTVTDGSAFLWSQHAVSGVGTSSPWVALSRSDLKITRLIKARRLETEDAKKIVIPHVVLASNGEDKKIVDEYAEVLVGEGKKSEVEYYGNMHHGWMGARANLSDAENLKEYERG